MMLAGDLGAPSADSMILPAYWTVVKARDDNQRIACEISLNHLLLILAVLTKSRSLLYILLIQSC